METYKKYLSEKKDFGYAELLGNFTLTDELADYLTNFNYYYSNWDFDKAEPYGKEAIKVMKKLIIEIPKEIKYWRKRQKERGKDWKGYKE